MISPKADAEVAEGMDELLGTYERHYNPEGAVVCMDEQSVPLVKDP